MSGGRCGHPSLPVPLSPPSVRAGITHWDQPLSPGTQGRAGRHSPNCGFFSRSCDGRVPSLTSDPGSNITLPPVGCVTLGKSLRFSGLLIPRHSAWSSCVAAAGPWNTGLHQWFSCYKSSFPLNLMNPHVAVEPTWPVHDGASCPLHPSSFKGPHRALPVRSGGPCSRWSRGDPRRITPRWIPAGY